MRILHAELLLLMNSLLSNPDNKLASPCGCLSNSRVTEDPSRLVYGNLIAILSNSDPP